MQPSSDAHPKPWTICIIDANDKALFVTIDPSETIDVLKKNIEASKRISPDKYVIMIDVNNCVNTSLGSIVGRKDSSRTPST